MTYGVWCRVSGGVTGTREAWMRDRDGNVKMFDALEEAQQEAAKWNDKRNHRYSLADFRYTAREMD